MLEPKPIQVDDPFTGEPVAEVPLLDAAAAGAALEAAAATQRRWAAAPLQERIALCRGVAGALAKDRDAIALEITRQMGKPISQAQAEVRTCLERIAGSIEQAEEALRPDQLPPVEGLRRWITHEPVGVVFDIAAWNYPLLIAVNVLIPAVLAGNSVLLKHAARTPLTGERFAHAFREAGAPADLVQSVQVDHRVAASLIDAAEVGYVSFTGSVRGGHEVYARVARRFIDAGLELGGKDAAYVAADADLEFAVENLADGAFFNAGQSCCGVERIYVHRSIYDRFLEGMVEAAGAYRLGDPREDSTSMGPLAQPTAMAHLADQVREARHLGGRLLHGGESVQVGGRGRFFEPTVIADALPSMSLMREESFGPIVGIAPVDSDEEAMARIDDSVFGLTASVWTRDPDRAERMGRTLRVGTVFLNRCDYLDPALPWTGWKDSGKGCSLSRYGFLAVTRRKSWHFKTIV